MALANSAATHNDFADARKHYTRALEIVRKQQEPDPFLEAVIGTRLGTTSFSMNRMAEAGNYFKAARDALAPLDNDIARIQLASANFWIGRYEIREENYAEATTALLNSLETLNRYPDAVSLAANNHIALVEVYEKQGMHAESTPHLLALAAEDKEPAAVYQVLAVNPSRRTRGEVRVSFVVDAEGYAREPQLVTAKIDNPDDYFQVASKALEQFRFVPKINNGQPVVSDRMEQVFQFQAGR